MKTLRFIFCSSVLSLFMLTSLLAQGTKANFAGTWAFNEAKSTKAEFRMAPDKIVVTQDANTLSAVRTTQWGEQTLKYTLDGKESQNPGFGESIQKSTATWSADGKVLTIVSVTPFEREGQKTEFKSTEVWKLTPENALSLESSFAGMDGQAQKTTAVYDKK